MKPAIKHSDKALTLLNQICGITKDELTTFLDATAHLLGPSSPVNPDVLPPPHHSQPSTPSSPNPPNPPKPTNSPSRKRSAAQRLLDEFTLADDIEAARTQIILDGCNRQIKRICNHMRHTPPSPSRTTHAPPTQSRPATRLQSQPMRTSPKPEAAAPRRAPRRGRDVVAGASKDSVVGCVSEEEDGGSDDDGAVYIPKRGTPSSDQQDDAVVYIPEKRTPSRDREADTRGFQSRNKVRKLEERDEKDDTVVRPAKARKTKGQSRAQSAGDKQGDVPKRIRRDFYTEEGDLIILPKTTKRGASGPRGLPDRDPGGPTPSDEVVEAVHIPQGSAGKDTAGDRGKRGKASASRKENSGASILEFARSGANSLAKVDKLDMRARLRKRCSLATFEGCDKFEMFSVATFFRALCSLHKDAVAFATVDGKDEKEDRMIDDIVCKANEEEFVREMTSGVGSTVSLREDRGPVPPFIERTADVLQLVFRLWQKMSTGDQDITKGFMKSLYEQRAVRAIADLATSVLKLWQKRNASIQHEQIRSELVECAIRMLANIFSFELGPVSIIPASIKLSDMGIREKDDNFSLPQLLDVVLDYIGPDAAIARECRLAATDMCHIYISRHQFGFPQECENGKAWGAIFKLNRGHVQSIIQHRAFWPIVAQYAIQAVKKKQGHDNNSKMAVAFLVSLLSDPAASRSLLESQSKVRHALLEVFLPILDRIGKKLVSCFREAEYQRISHPELPFVPDLVRRLMSFAVVQREIVTSSALDGRKKFVDAIENIITSAAKLVQGTFDSAKVMAAAECRGLGKLGDELQTALSVPSNGRGASQGGTESESEAPETAKLTAVAVHRALAFAAWLIGSLGKSMEDGSRDMSQMNGLHVLVSSKCPSLRKLYKLWIDVVKIQTCVEEKIPLSIQEMRGSTEMPDLSREVLLSAQDRNHFSMVVEGIRQKLASDMKVRRARSSPWSQKQPSRVNRGNFVSDTKSEGKITFPAVSRLKELRSAVCLPKGHQDLDDDPQMLGHLERVMRSEAEDVLSRYDVDSDIMFKWVRLQKKNAYVDDARELLDRVDRTLGHPCSCLPGNPTESGNSNQHNIACANDACENRSTKVECVPGECGAGSYCKNQRLQRQEYAKYRIHSFPKKGLGVLANEDIPAGTFIGEYQGEVISKDEFEKRRKLYRGEKHFYFMKLTAKLIIDASRKSQFTRFVNHCCNPNAETQKWNAGGEPRVGIFAKRDIRKGDEITFDYGASSLENDSVPCLCGANNCRGTLTSKGGKDKEEDVPIDEAGLANPHSSPAKDAMSAEKEKEAESKEREKLEEQLNKKIEKAKERLHLAAELSSQKCDAKEKFKPLDESSLSERMKSRLTEWESSVGKRKEEPKNMSSLPKASSSKPEPRVRIPRRPQPSILITHAAHLKKKEEEEMASRLNKASHKRQVTSASRQPEHPQVWYQRFGRLHAAQGSGTRLERSETEATGSASKPDIKNGPQAPKKDIPVFAPTSTKFKRPRLKPKTAERIRKKKRDNEESDSMDGYSTASSVEPILEEPENSDVPDGLGACSDDEFVAAPPIVPEPENWDNARRDGSYRDQEHGQTRERRDNAERDQRHPLRGPYPRAYEGHQSPRYRVDYRSGAHAASRTGNGAYDRYGHDTRRRMTPPQDRFPRNYGRSGSQGERGTLLRQDRNMNRTGFVAERGRDMSHRPSQAFDWQRDNTLPRNPDQPHADMDKAGRGDSNSRADVERENTSLAENRGQLRDHPQRSFHQERRYWTSTGNADPLGSHTGRSGRKVESRASYRGSPERENRTRIGVNVDPDLPHSSVEGRSVPRHQKASSTRPDTDKDLSKGTQQGLSGPNSIVAKGEAPSGPIPKKDTDRHDPKMNPAESTRRIDQRTDRRLDEAPSNDFHGTEPKSASRNAIPMRSELNRSEGSVHNVGPNAGKESLDNNRCDKLPRQSGGRDGAGDPLQIATSTKDENQGQPVVSELKSGGDAKCHSGSDNTGGNGKEKVFGDCAGKEEIQIKQSSLSNEVQTEIVKEDAKQELAQSTRERTSDTKPILGMRQDTGGLKSISRPDSNGIQRERRTRWASANATNSSDAGPSLQQGGHLREASIGKVGASHRNEEKGFGDEKQIDVPSQGHDAAASGRLERAGSTVKRSSYTSRFEKRDDTADGGAKRARNDNDWSQGKGRRPQGNDEPLEGSRARHGPGHERALGGGSGVLDRVGRRSMDGFDYNARPQLDSMRRSGSGGGYGRNWPGGEGGNLRRMPFRGDRWSPKWDGRREPRSPRYDGGNGRYTRVTDGHPQGRSGGAGGMDRRGHTEHVSGPAGQRGQEHRRGQDGNRSPRHDGGNGRFPRIANVHPRSRMSGGAGGMDRWVNPEHLSGPVRQRGQEYRRGRDGDRSPRYHGGNGRYTREVDVHPQGRMGAEAGGMDRRVNTGHLSGPVRQRGQEQRRGRDGERGGNDLRTLIPKKSRP